MIIYRLAVYTVNAGVTSITAVYKWVEPKLSQNSLNPAVTHSPVPTFAPLLFSIIIHFIIIIHPLMKNN